jgi:hypothetical protein
LHFAIENWINSKTGSVLASGGKCKEKEEKRNPFFPEIL